MGGIGRWLPADGYANRACVRMCIVERGLHCRALEAATAVGPREFRRRDGWTALRDGIRARAGGSEERDENQDNCDTTRHRNESTGRGLAEEFRHAQLGYVGVGLDGFKQRWTVELAYVVLADGHGWGAREDAAHEAFEYEHFMH